MSFATRALMRCVKALASRITFTDPFTGTDGSAPNARWTRILGTSFTIQGNAVANDGPDYGELAASCTPGDNDFSVDCTGAGWFNAGLYAYVILRYASGSDWVACYRDEADNAKLKIVTYNGTAVVTLAADSTNTSFTGGNIRLTNVGNTITLYRDGTQVAQVTTTAGAGASQVVLAINFGHSDARFDNAVLA